MIEIRKLLALSLMTCLPLAAEAQDFGAPVGEPKKEESREDDRSRVVKVKDWTIKKEVNTLTLSMKSFNGLIKSLSKANKDLGDEFKKYLNDPDNELLASRVERKLAAYAANVSKEFDTIIASQDVFTSNFRNLRHKLTMLSKHLQGKAKGFRSQLKEYQEKKNEYDKNLRKIAAQIKDPDLDPAARKRLKREFAIQYRRYQMQKRYLKGYTSRYKGYLRLQQNMGGLSNLFGELHIKFEDLITNLENEKKYLRASIELHADALRIKKLIREGIVGGEKAITNVSEKLAKLYIKVDTFNDVHDRISQQMNRFIDSQGPLVGITEKINQIGGKGSAFGALNKDLDKLIDEFAAKDDDLDLDGEIDPAAPKEGEKRDN